MRIALTAAYCMCPVLFAWGQASELSPPVAVFMDFDSRPGAASLEIMKQEVGELFKPAGVTLDWRLSRENDGTEAFANVVVVKFKGRCQAEFAPQHGTDFGTLGETYALGMTKVAHGHVLPFTEVECDQVRKALAYLRPGAGTVERQNALGMVMGRVVAHELYHILARTTAHTAGGLTKASQSLKDLVGSGDLTFQEAASQAIREGQMQHPPHSD